MALFGLPGLTLPDSLQIQNNHDGDVPIVMLDYRAPSGCVNDKVLPAPGDKANFGEAIGNGLAAHETCNSEVAVFSKNNAMALAAGVDWTERSYFPVKLLDVVTMRVAVWIVNDKLPAAAPGNELSNANMVFNKNKVGVQFRLRPDEIKNISNVSGAVTAIGSGCPSREGLVKLQRNGWYRSGQLNVYYVKTMDSDEAGANCAIDRNIIYLSAKANLATLSHEIGHAYGLNPNGHTDGMQGFNNSNLMRSGGPLRDHFSLGQAFRMNVNNGSRLTENCKLDPQCKWRNPKTWHCPPIIPGKQKSCPFVTMAWP
jgi:hypothetical protein